MAFLFQTPLQHGAVFRLVVDDENARRDRGGTNVRGFVAGDGDATSCSGDVCLGAVSQSLGFAAGRFDPISDQRDAARLNFARDQFGKTAGRAADFFQILPRPRMRVAFEVFGDQLGIPDDLVER
ncbi:MAG: hypothetical protein ACKOKC_06350, partial [Chthoniobacterales bacterium]